MMTSSRLRDADDSFAGRRGHASQLSISDPSHHVTEAIGTLYGDDDDYTGGPDGRPLSFMAAPYGAEQQHLRRPDPVDDPRRALLRTTSDKAVVTVNTATNGNPSMKKAQTLPARMPSQRSSSLEAPMSPVSPMSPASPSLRDMQQADESGSQFPMTNIDNPGDIALELSNLQALRRMSMDVSNNSDPDLLPFSSLSLMPSIPPRGDDDEADPSRLLWVPARVHPELDTTAFKNFLENRVQSMKRRSGESMLSVDGLERNNSGSLRRKKSTLSRQIDSSVENADDYSDGADKLMRSDSQGAAPAGVSLDELVKDPTKVVRKLTQSQRQRDGGAEPDMNEDMPILPAAPGMGLRRSTRTTYRKGGSLRGDRVPFAKRIAAKQAEKETGEAAAAAAATTAPTSPPLEPPPGHGLTRVQSEPVAVTDNFSRPARSVRRQQNFSRESPTSPPSAAMDTAQEPSEPTPTSPPSSETSQKLPFRSPAAMAQRAAAPVIPQIVETPAAEETSPAESEQSSRPYPQRSSSQTTTQQQPQQQQLYNQQQQADEPPARSSKRPPASRPLQTSPTQPTQASVVEKQAPTPGQTINDMASHPSLLPGSGGTRTDSLTFIPTMSPAEDRKSDRKSTGGEDSGHSTTTKTSGWKWFKSDDRERKKKEKEREREREREREEQAKKARTKSVGERSHDNARLDVLQSSIDNVVSKGRESLLLDRDSIDNKLHEERKKESNRKSSESKKEKDSFFGGLFGGSKRKSEKEPGSKKKDNSTLVPEPPARPLRADVDYPWTRFTIIEERAIYRMAHIKLANPRRSLQSQVLLSNFMYSYLAKVQAMHPQLNVPMSPQQKRQEEERRRKEAEEQQLLEQQMAQQQAAEDGNFDFEYHRAGNQYGDASGHQDGPTDYVDDAEIYQYDHGDQHDDGTSHGGGYQNGGAQAHDGYGQGHQRQRSGNQQGYYYGQQGNNGRYEDDDHEGDMW